MIVKMITAFYFAMLGCNMFMVFFLIDLYSSLWIYGEEEVHAYIYEIFSIF